ncbi:S8 family serine peptidase [Chondromyces crocatus]|uniref:Serine protease n=1 Tax=Chondromyces crocatus TaxID=52 RepID=A0A0K1E6Q6_CHOCO|nr:S8 family serine peptidase [Chondromyces crocatus]AKT36248.1 serine protease [Chondromyces crocatus]
MLRPQFLSIPERLEASREHRGRGVVMGFVDVGFYPHPDLMQPRRRIKAYADAAQDEPVGSEFFTAQPYGWHGTMTACSAAGNGYVSGGRYRGLASEADVVLIKAGIDGGRVRGKHVAHAIRLPLRYPQLGIRILNVSLGLFHDDPDRHDVERAVKEVVEAGITVFAAAGNTAGQMPPLPGAAAEAITVGGGRIRGIEEGEDAPWPSSYGSPKPGVHKPDLLAPAIWVPAPMLPGTLVAREAIALFQLLTVLEEATAEHGFSETRQTATPDEQNSVQGLLRAVAGRIERCKYISQEYQHVDGTSFASPITASVAAQMLEACPKLTPKELREGLLATAEPLKNVDRAVQGAGVLQPLRAVEWAVRRAAGDQSSA